MVLMGQHYVVHCVSLFLLLRGHCYLCGVQGPTETEVEIETG